MAAEALIAACHSAACAPPPAGTGGSTKGARGALSRAIAAIKAPASNVDRTKRNSLEYVSHAERTGKPAPAAAPKKSSALARAWKAVSANPGTTNVMDAVRNPRSPAEVAVSRAYKAKQRKSQLPVAASI